MRSVLLVFLPIVFSASSLFAQPYGLPDRESPGDEAIQAFLARDAEAIHAEFLKSVRTDGAFLERRGRWREELRDMLSIPDVESEAPLHVRITNKQVIGDVVVQNLHFQSLPRLYVTANLYRPRSATTTGRRPAILYVCGHSGRGRNGNKTAFQSHGLWFARHGYVCLVLDTLQLGEIAATHHGTYREGRWWWHSLGYTPAGIECLNGIRGIDYLRSRGDVDPDRIGVTGISGGGATTFWIAAMDERIAAAVPVSGMADLPSYVGNRVINGHCDCMFAYNTFRWPWARIAALVAPRPLLFANSDQDRIFPMDANERVINRLERVYSLFGAGDRVDAVVSIGGHAYREDLRKAIYRFLNTHLKGDAREVTDSEVDLVVSKNGARVHPISIESLRAFATDDDLPRDQINTTVDRVLADRALERLQRIEPSDAWREHALAQLRLRPFATIPGKVPPASVVSGEEEGKLVLESESGVRFSIERLVQGEKKTSALLVVVGREGEESRVDDWKAPSRRGDASVWICRPRGVGSTRWTRRDPPNYVERSHLLLGRTVDAERVRDVLAAAQLLRSRKKIESLGVGGTEVGSVIAAYAGVLDDSIAGVHLIDPPASHLDEKSPAFLKVLHTCDVPEAIGLVAPRRVVLEGSSEKLASRVKLFFRAAKADEQLRVVPSQRR